MQANNYDAIIVGGGPCGATAATILAIHGKKVIVLEKEKFPRYHIGESLLPYCYFVFERLGVLEHLQDSVYPHKYSVQFVGVSGRVSQPFYFFQHYDHPSSTTWQVSRDAFDQMMLDNTRKKGAEVLEQTQVTEFIEEDNRIVGVQAKNTAGESLEFRAPWTIDATGRDMLAIKQHRWRERDPQLNKTTIWTYYKNTKRDPGKDEGATTIANLPGKGWFWHIPLSENRLSVGLVAERDYLYRETIRDPAEIFQREAALQPWIAEHLQPGEQEGRYYVDADFSYRSKHCSRNGLVLAGDAMAFLDPVFSSGIYLALKSGEQVADTVADALESGNTDAACFALYGEQMNAGIEAMRKLVYAFYDEQFSFGKLMRSNPDLRGDLTDCLIGNLSRDFQKLFDGIAQIATVPEPLPVGTPTPSLPEEK